MERTSRQLHRLVERSGLKDIDEIQRLLVGRVLPPDSEEPDGADPREHAQQLAFKAIEAGDGRVAADLCRRALKLDPDCVDALARSGRLKARSPTMLVKALEAAVGAGERSLGEAFFEENRGHFWGLVGTRPYLRARHDLAMLLLEIGRTDEARQHREVLLDLKRRRSAAVDRKPKAMSNTRRNAIRRYLQNGDHDPLSAAWPGDVPSRARQATRELKAALCEEVQRRARARPSPPELGTLDLVAFTRTRVAPMVRGLFPRREQDVVIGVLERSVVGLTPANVLSVLQNLAYVSSAWNVANLYLVSVGAESLARDAPQLVGLSEATTCYVSAEYFRAEDPLADFVVHEATHVFHNCKRGTSGLPETRRKEWLLDIDFARRETFAYACETLSCILRMAEGSRARAELLAGLADDRFPSNGSIDSKEYRNILEEAVAARNGWKVILKRCVPRPLIRTRAPALVEWAPLPASPGAPAWPAGGGGRRES